MPKTFVEDMLDLYAGKSEMPSVVKAMQTQRATLGTAEYFEDNGDKRRANNEPLIDTYNKRNNTCLDDDVYTCSLGLSNRLQDAGVKFTPAAGVVSLRDQFHVINPNNVEPGDILNYGKHHNVMITNTAEPRTTGIRDYFVEGNETADNELTKSGTLNKWTMDINPVSVKTPNDGQWNTVRSVEYPRYIPSEKEMPTVISAIVGNHVNRKLYEYSIDTPTQQRIAMILENTFWSGGKLDSPALARYKNTTKE